MFWASCASCSQEASNNNMHSCTNPAGRLKSNQRGFWIETLVLCPGDLLSKSSNFFQKKVVGGQSPVNDRRVGGKHNTVKQADSGLGGWMLRNFQGESLKLITSLRFVRLPSVWPWHGWDSSRWLPTPPCPSSTPTVYPNPCPSIQWCHPTISSSVIPFPSCPQSLPASGSFPMS